jgi:class 3 adenylate cyclase
VKERLACWGLLALALLVAGQATLDAWRAVGRPYPGFGVMSNLLVAVGGFETGDLAPFDLVRAMNGRLLASGREIQAEVRAAPAGTSFRYIVNRRGRLVEADITSQSRTVHGFQRYLLEGLLPGLLYLGMGAVVLWLRPGAPDTRLFLAFCLLWFCIATLYMDANLTYRFSPLFLAAFAFSPAVFIHLALTFPERRAIARRYPRLVWVPYALSALIALGLQEPLPGLPIAWSFVLPALAAADWGLALLLLVVSLARTSLSGATPLVRQRARVLVAGFAAGQLLPVLGTAAEAVFRAPVPYLNELWRLNLLFPLAVAYAMVRYNLFDLRAVVRTGTIYGAVTGLVVLAYAGSITLLNMLFSRADVAVSPVIPAAVLGLAVVLFLNPVYLKTQDVVDRVFFRQRLDIQHSIERLSARMTSLLDLGRIAELIAGTVAESFHPRSQVLLLLDEGRQGYRPPGVADPGALPLPRDSRLARRLAEERAPLTRERVEEDPRLSEGRDACARELRSLGAAVAVPILFQDGLTGILALGEKRSGAAYTTEDLRLLRVIVNQSAVALENAKAYAALESANADLRAALRRVEILESIRVSLAKFVPRTVQALIEQAPEAPELGKREADVSVLFVDIAGYTRLSERLDRDTVTDVVERYFGAFLDEILRHGGDVNETAGDGLMVIFQDADSARHARAAARTALAILRRAREINAEPASPTDPIALHIGLNSGLAAVGATKIEGTTGTRWTYTASGAVTNLAARLAALDAGGDILVGPETRGRLDPEFLLEDLGERRLKNVEEPVRVYRLLEPGGAGRSA